MLVTMLHVVIMAGGSGTRFWPASRKAFPKQFLQFGGERSLIQQARDRVSDLVLPGNIWVVTNRQYGEITRTQLPDVPADQVLEEPCGRNTAPCIGWAAARITQIDPDAQLLVMPADHTIAPVAAFTRCVREACDWIAANPDASVLFGVPPTYPATGFGYIERGARVDESRRVEQVPSFREKPALAVAQEFVASGKFLWNCGIFVWRAARLRQLLAQFEPELARDLETLVAAESSGEAVDHCDGLFAGLKAISIDHAVLERADQVYVLPATFEWDDVGSWQALARSLGTDATGNTVIGHHAGIDTQGCIIEAGAGHLVATCGVSDLVIVATPQATLVVRKDDETALRRIVQHLESHGYGQYL